MRKLEEIRESMHQDGYLPSFIDLQRDLIDHLIAQEKRIAELECIQRAIVANRGGLGAVLDIKKESTTGTAPTPLRLKSVEELAETWSPNRDVCRGNAEGIRRARQEIRELCAAMVEDSATSDEWRSERSGGYRRAMCELIAEIDRAGGAK